MSKRQFENRHPNKAGALLSARTEPTDIQKEPIMKYALLNRLPKEQFDVRNDPSLITAWKSYVDAIQASGVLKNSVGLQPPEKATMVSVRGGKRQVHDGPYPETKEMLGGLFIIEVPDLDAALEWAARSPAAGYGSVEVRPLWGS
jgi:hypothetical protein